MNTSLAMTSHTNTVLGTVRRETAGVLPLSKTIGVISFSPLSPVNLKNFHKEHLIGNPKDREKMIRIRLYHSALMKGVFSV